MLLSKLTSPAYTSHHPSNPKFVKLLYQHTRGSGQDFRAGGGLSAAQKSFGQDFAKFQLWSI
jgi:hypothetical protein